MAYNEIVTRWRKRAADLRQQRDQFIPHSSSWAEFDAASRERDAAADELEALEEKN